VTKFNFKILALLFLLSSSCTAVSPQPLASVPSSPNYPPLVEKIIEGLPSPQPAFRLFYPGVNSPVDYAKFGEFQNPGTAQYRYVVKDVAGLKAAVGIGIYPDDVGISRDPQFQEYKKSGALAGWVWDWLKSPDLQKAFYAWASSLEERGEKTFFTAVVLERAGLLLPALKAYYAALVHFPRSACWSADRSFVWYIAPAAITSIKRLCRDYPQLGVELVDATFSIQNGDDKNLNNDIITVNPGHFIKKTVADRKKDLPDLSKLKIVETRGKGKVTLVRFENGHWQLRVDGKPLFVHGVTYAPTEIGLGPLNNPRFYDSWQFTDKNKDGIIDAPYQAWVDKNKNEIPDADEPSVGDFTLLKEMGVNAIRFIVPTETDRLTYNPALVNKPLLRDLHSRYGIWVIATDYLGAYTLGSGASWEQGTDYTDPQQCQRMKDLVRAKVLDLKDEPFVLMWVLGNENNMPGDYSGVNATRTNAGSQPGAYARFLNEVAAMIHELDPNHPVAVGNMEVNLLDYYQKYAPELDIVGINSYRSRDGFGTMWEAAEKQFDRPILITEYGCDAYYQGRGEDEAGQLDYLRGNYRDLVFHQAGGPYTGHAIGGVIFEYLDEWWKDTSGHPENLHQTEAQFPMGFPDGLDHEEWLGIISQGNGDASPFKRQLRQAYFYYKENPPYSNGW